MLTAKLAEEPNYPLPDGFTKTKEIQPVFTYEIPFATAQIIGDARSISVCIIDDLLNELFGIHILPAKVTLEEGYKVTKNFKPGASPAPKNNRAQAVEIMEKFEEANEEAKSHHSTKETSEKEKLSNLIQKSQ